MLWYLLYTSKIIVTDLTFDELFSISENRLENSQKFRFPFFKSGHEFFRTKI